jgi:MFS family permease
MELTVSTLETSAAPAESANAMHYARFQLYWLARAAAVMAIQITSVSVGWAIYELTRSAFMLGLVGLVQFVPSLLLVLLTGQIADRYSRRNIMLGCTLLEALCVGFILVEIEAGISSVIPIFIALIGFGVARAFFGPAVQSLMANVVPARALPSAISWSTGAWQLATILGPVIGGLLYGISAGIAFGTALALFALASLLSVFIRDGRRTGGKKAAGWSDVMAGFSYVRSQPVVLGAISLDLFIVLLGGATALLPVVALDILEAGPWALGVLRAAAGVGGIAVALWLAYRPIRAHAGHILFASVFLFGLATVVFGLSQSIVISVAALVLVGAADMVSVYIRSSIIQLMTPDHIRGRVSALNMVFVGASNELGEFRAGSIASVTGAASAIVLGGAGSMAIAAIWFFRFVDLRRIVSLGR